MSMNKRLSWRESSHPTHLLIPFSVKLFAIERQLVCPPFFSTLLIATLLQNLIMACLTKLQCRVFSACKEKEECAVFYDKLASSSCLRCWDLLWYESSVSPQSASNGFATQSSSPSSLESHLLVLPFIHRSHQKDLFNGLCLLESSKKRASLSSADVIPSEVFFSMIYSSHPCLTAHLHRHLRRRNTMTSLQSSASLFATLVIASCVSIVLTNAAASSKSGESFSSFEISWPFEMRFQGVRHHFESRSSLVLRDRLNSFFRWCQKEYQGILAVELKFFVRDFVSDVWLMENGVKDSVNCLPVFLDNSDVVNLALRCL